MAPGVLFAGVVELIIIMPKKNGKTTLVAALALYHLLMTPAAECVIGAASERQAAILYNQAANLVIQSDLHRRRKEGKSKYAEFEGVFDVSRGSWVIRYELGRIRVLPADIRTAQGVIPTLAIVDEYQHHPTSGLYAIFRDGLTPRHGQMITITNPGVDFDSPLGRLREEAIRAPCQKRGRRRLYTSSDGSVVLVEWGLEDGDDTNDLTLVKMANPAPWQTVAELRRRRDSWSVRVSPGEWVRYACGRWGLDEPAVDPETWDALKGDIGGLTAGDEVFLAVRVTQGGGCGIGIAAPKDKDRVAVACEMLPYDFPGLEFRLRQLDETYRIRNIYGYAPQFGIGVDVMRDHGLPMEDLAQSPMRLMEATSTFLTLVASHRLVHDGDPALRKQVLSAAIREAPTGSYFLPTKEVQGLIAVTLAADQASQWSPSPLVLLPSGSVG